VIFEQLLDRGGRRRLRRKDPHPLRIVEAPPRKTLDRRVQVLVERELEHKLTVARARTQPHIRRARLGRALQRRDQRVEVGVPGRTAQVHFGSLSQPQHRRDRPRILPRHARHREPVTGCLQRPPIRRIALGARAVTRLEHAAARARLIAPAALLVLHPAPTRTRTIGGPGRSPPQS